MKFISVLLGLGLLSATPIGISAPLFPGIMLIPHATPRVVPRVPATWRYDIHCDAGKTLIVEEWQRNEIGEVRRTIAISTMARNTYMLGVAGPMLFTQMKTEHGRFTDVQIDLWESNISTDSPNYYLKTKQKPNDCTIMK